MSWNGRRHFVLHRYVVWEVMTPAVLAMVVLSLIGPINEMRERTRELPLEFLELWDVVRLIAYFLPTIVSYVIPITYMLGILMAFGRLAQNNEITAMKAAGIPLKQVVMPVIALGAVLSAFCFLLQDRVQPAAFARVNALIFQELPKRITLEVLPPGVMHEFGNWRIYYRDRDVATKTLLNVEIMDQVTAGERKIYLAESAQFSDGDTSTALLLRNGQYIHLRSSTRPIRGMFETTEIMMPKKGLPTETGRKRTLQLGELFTEEQAIAQRYEAQPSQSLGKRVLSLRVEIADRISLSLACLMVSLVAAPLAVRGSRAGRAHGFALGFGILLVYYTLKLGLEPRAGVPGLTETVLRAMTPNLVLGAAGVWALWRVDRI
ncbi:MAG: hypothetical protein AMXMBFR84_01240 [Candidatus Hydrogenedentota bacterium]